MFLKKYGNLVLSRFTDLFLRSDQINYIEYHRNLFYPVIFRFPLFMYIFFYPSPF